MVEVEKMPCSRITMQHLKPLDSRFPISQVDARIAGTGISPPPNIFLDFMYGVAAYQSKPLRPQVMVTTPQDRGKNHRSHMSDGMLDAMDNVLMLSMLLKGRTPQSIAAERQRREEEEELIVQKGGQVKAQQWIQSLRCVFSYL
jgi:hypothetical protein